MQGVAAANLMEVIFLIIYYNKRGNFMKKNKGSGLCNVFFAGTNYMLMVVFHGCSNMKLTEFRSRRKKEPYWQVFGM